MPKGPYYSLITFMPRTLARGFVQACAKRTPSMTIDRVIDGESKLYVGITALTNNNNPITGQCMR